MTNATQLRYTYQCHILMKKSDKIIKQLKQIGSRATKPRQRLVEIFDRHPLPLTELELRKKLATARIRVNKTTVYRALTHLKKEGVIREVNFGDGKKRYELISTGHHHHLICTECHRVDKIEMAKDVSWIEKKINKKKQFQITSHALEFFGICRRCTNL